MQEEISLGEWCILLRLNVLTLGEHQWYAVVLSVHTCEDGRVIGLDDREQLKP